MNHQNNRSYYQLNTTNMLSTKRVPSLTPPKNYHNSNSRDRITKQIKDKAANNILKAEGLNFPIQNALFLQQQNTILSARKATINLSESSDKLRKTSPNQKSPNNPRLSTMQKNKSISISQSQQAIAQVLAKMQENDNISYINKQLYRIPEIESTQKSTINSREYTNSSKHKTEDYQKLLKENLILQKKVCKLEQKILELELLNQQLLSLSKPCECHLSQLKELEQGIGNKNQIQDIVNPLQLQNVDHLNIQSREDQQKKRSSNCQEYSDVKPQNLFDYQNSNQIIDQLIEQYKINTQELAVFKGLTKVMDQNSLPIPSVLKTLSLVIKI
ncbi:unnamed protein product [Paramecium octaurelia]|uniref:Uncharacterized protein n=1 Tax=Paramecium octaurelia TaxID=43137 RepID=A0A8S1TQF2_PAROT|nr:unnamed protein product [Paramecium octaurelia]